MGPRSSGNQARHLRRLGAPQSFDKAGGRAQHRGLRTLLSLFLSWLFWLFSPLLGVSPRRTAATFAPTVVLALVIAALSLVALPRGVQAAGEETARAHHEQGRLAASLGRFETAISEYRRAYELKADPSYLYDIAEAHRALGASERAVFFYRRYLSTHPNPPNRPEVESQIAQLEPSLPPDAAATAAAANPAPPPPSPLAIAAPAQHGVSEHERSVVGRWWFWTAVGALAAAGATVAILAATRDSGGAEVPPSRLGNMRVDF